MTVIIQLENLTSRLLSKMPKIGICKTILRFVVSYFDGGI